jgi:hypothetical protein
MRCQRASVPEASYLEEVPRGFKDHLVQLDMKNWMRLFRCSECGASWVIDEWDRYQWQVVFRVATGEDWAAVDRETQRKQLLLKSRGGNASESCIWVGCSNPRVQGVAYCLDHLYATGARK